MTPAAARRLAALAKLAALRDLGALAEARAALAAIDAETRDAEAALRAEAAATGESLAAQRAFTAFSEAERRRAEARALRRVEAETAELAAEGEARRGRGREQASETLLSRAIAEAARDAEIREERERPPEPVRRRRTGA